MTSAIPLTSNLLVQERVPLREHVCLPGDVALSVGANATVAVGGGLRSVASGRDSAAAVYMLAEVCAPMDRSTMPGGPTGVARYTLESPAPRRYTYAVGDPVVAIVARKVSSHFYYCYTGGPGLAALDALAFDGATKANRPRLLEGDVLFARVQSTGAAPEAPAAAGGLVSTSASGEPELSCTAAEVGLVAKDWTSGESIFGPLREGRVLEVPLPYARSLLTPCEAAVIASGDAQAVVPASYLLTLLGARVPFEICVGMNGLVWVRGHPSDLDMNAEVRRTVAVCSCLKEAQYDSTKEELEARVASYFPE